MEQGVLSNNGSSSHEQCVQQLQTQRDTHTTEIGNDTFHMKSLHVYYRTRICHHTHRNRNSQMNKMNIGSIRARSRLGHSLVAHSDCLSRNGLWTTTRRRYLKATKRTSFTWMILPYFTGVPSSFLFSSSFFFFSNSAARCVNKMRVIVNSLQAECNA